MVDRRYIFPKHRRDQHDMRHHYKGMPDSTLVAELIAHAQYMDEDRDHIAKVYKEDGPEGWDLLLKLVESNPDWWVLEGEGRRCFTCKADTSWGDHHPRCPIDPLLKHIRKSGGPVRLSPDGCTCPPYRPDRHCALHGIVAEERDRAERWEPKPEHVECHQLWIRLGLAHRRINELETELWVATRPDTPDEYPVTSDDVDRLSE